MKLVPPTVALRSSFLDSLEEWEGGLKHGAGIKEHYDLENEADFQAWVEGLRAEESTPFRPDWVPCSYFWMVEDDQFAGTIALRHELNDFLLNYGGHVGYSVRPSFRRRGLAKAAVGEIKTIAKDMGIDRLLIMCEEDNAASQGVIVSNGGVLEDIRVDPDGDRLLRHWIDLG